MSELPSVVRQCSWDRRRSSQPGYVLIQNTFRLEECLWFHGKIRPPKLSKWKADILGSVGFSAGSEVSIMALSDFAEAVPGKHLNTRHNINPTVGIGKSDACSVANHHQLRRWPLWSPGPLSRPQVVLLNMDPYICISHNYMYSLQEQTCISRCSKHNFIRDNVIQFQ